MKLKIVSIGAFVLCSNIIYSQCACCAGTSIGSSNGDYNNGVFNLSQGKILIETYADYRAFKDDGGGHDMPEMESMPSSESDEETPLETMMISSVGVKYGLNRHITLSALLPYVFLNTNAGRDKAMGDVILLYTFGMLSRNNLNLAISGGLELPTGQQKGSSFDNTTIVVGSGSFDPMLGLSASKKWNKLLLQFNTVGKYTTKGFDNTNLRSLSVQNVALSYQLAGSDENCPDSLQKSMDVRWTISGGYYGEWLGAINVDGEKDLNSGYYLGFGTVSTAVSLTGFSIPIRLSHPLIQNLNGNQSNAGFRIRVGIVKTF